MFICDTDSQITVVSPCITSSYTSSCDRAEPVSLYPSIQIRGVW